VGLKILWGILLGLWLVFVLMGRGGFIHLLLLCGISVLMIDLVSMYRARGVRVEAGPAEENELERS
jgi:hypothetical protein